MDVRLQQLLKDRCSDQPALHPETPAFPTVTSDPCMASAQLAKCFSYSELRDSLFRLLVRFWPESVN